MSEDEKDESKKATVHQLLVFSEGYPWAGAAYLLKLLYPWVLLLHDRHHPAG